MVRPAPGGPKNELTMKINILSVSIDGIPYAYPFTGDKLGLLKAWIAKAKEILGDGVVSCDDDDFIESLLSVTMGVEDEDGDIIHVFAWVEEKEIDGPIKFDQDIF